MAYLGYDPAAIDRLRSAMAAADDSLHSLGCADRAAAAAVDAVRRARSTLGGTWLPLLANLQRCVALTGYRPVLPDGSDLAAFRLRPSAVAGWLFVTDPLSEPPLTICAALSLAATLEQGDVDALTDSADERALLHTQLLQIAASPELLGAFRAVFTRWGELADALGRQFQVADEQAWQSPSGGDADGTRRAAAIAAVVSALAATLPAGDRRRLLGTVSPTTAALLLDGLDLAAGDLAAVVQDVMCRVLTSPDHSAHPLDGRPNDADRLLRRLLATDGAPTAYLRLTADAPQLVWETAVDRRLVADVFTTGTSPTQIGAADAQHLVMANIDYVRANWADSWWLATPAVLAEALAPWLLQLSSLNGSWRLVDGDTEADVTAKHDLLRDLVDDPQAAAALVGGAAELAALPAQGSAAELAERADAVAELIGLLGRLDVYERAADAEASADAWDHVTGLLTAAIGAVPVGGIVAGTALDVALDEAIGIAGEHDWFGAPDECGTRASAEQAQRRRLVVAAAVTVRAYVIAARRSALIPATVSDPPPPPGADGDVELDWTRSFADWLDSTRLDGLQRERLAALSKSFVNPRDVGESIAAGRAGCGG